MGDNLTGLEPIPGFQQYKCHKVVLAAKISTHTDPRLAGPVTLFLGPTAAPFEVSKEWFERHKPAYDWYVVVYADGFISASPPEAFEEGYSLDVPTT